MGEKQDHMASQGLNNDRCGSRDDLTAPATAALANGWGPDGEKVKAAVRGLTRAERELVKDGCIHGDFRMSTVRNLKRKGMFYLKITSPNGQCGFMELTPLGLNAQALIKSRQAARGAA